MVRVRHSLDSLINSLCPSRGSSDPSWGPANTLERNHTSVTNATMLQLIQTIRRSTKGPTLGKSLTDAQLASFPALELLSWKCTWWGCTQEKSRSIVTSATTPLLLLVICSSTWWRILGWNLSSATNAAKLTHERTCSQSIPESTRPRSRLWLLI